MKKSLPNFAFHSQLLIRSKWLQSILRLTVVPSMPHQHVTNLSPVVSFLKGHIDMHAAHQQPHQNF